MKIGALSLSRNARRAVSLSFAARWVLPALIGLSAMDATAFSLLGPYEDWMQPTNGFHQPGDIGGPMNLGEEYRWNVPVVTYTFDSSFLDYFGATGVAAVESAMSVLNSLPPASQMDPGNYPTAASLVNPAAASLGLLDLKSQTLSTLLEQLGLASPSRYAFCLHDFNISSGNINDPVVIQRSFDPFTYASSSNVNDTRLSYALTNLDPSLRFWDAVEFAMDPLSPLPTAVADGLPQAGTCFTGLTRDDVGGLRYLLHTNNLNLEILLPDVHGIGPNAESYVSQTIRPGVDKIMFVRRDYDSLLGQYFAPFTNQFTDSYASNSVRVQQQVERVITAPDILFSAADTRDDHGWAPMVVRPGASNWWSGNLMPGMAGPGVIIPPIQIRFNKLTATVLTSDTLPNGPAQVNDHRWGSFDGSTNAPVIYPPGSSPETGPLSLSLWLHNAGDARAASYFWEVPLGPGSRTALQVSSNLTDWVTLATITNRGVPVDWHHVRSAGQRFLRAVPE